MAEWLFETGIGEDRAALIEGGEVVEARIDRHDGRPRVGDVIAGRLTRRAGPAGRSEVTLNNGGTVLLAPVPPGLTEGGPLLVEIVREAIPERDNPKLSLARLADGEARPAPAMIEELRSGGTSSRTAGTHGPDLLEQAGWSDLIEQAETGLVPFPGGLLRIALTPAMTVIDVDGDLPAAELAVRGAAAAGAAIRRFGIGGSIGIDLPTVASKQHRLHAAEALDAVLPQPFERTAVNGFGFLQIVRRRVRPSLLELIQSDLAQAAALALLRQLEREPPPAKPEIGAPPAVARFLNQRPDWLAELAKRRGAAVRIVDDANRPSL